MEVKLHLILKSTLRRSDWELHVTAILLSEYPSDKRGGWGMLQNCLGHSDDEWKISTPISTFKPKDSHITD
jgi:hypothetical protein